MTQLRNCIIIDDEPPARTVLKTYIDTIPQLELKAECANAVEALSYLRGHKTDVIFLDIQMPKLLGTDLVRILQNRPDIIFTTAHKGYAVEGFELDAVDYLVKPISFERFLKAVHKLGHKTDPGSPVLPGQQEKETGAPADFLYFRVERKMKKVWLCHIIYIESLKDYVKIVTTEGTIVTKQPISSLEAMLPGGRFIRIHRSYIISRTKVSAFTAEWVELGELQLPIGRLYRQMVTLRLQES